MTHGSSRCVIDCNTIDVLSLHRNDKYTSHPSEKHTWFDGGCCCALICEAMPCTTGNHSQSVCTVLTVCQNLPGSALSSKFKVVLSKAMASPTPTPAFEVFTRPLSVQRRTQRYICGPSRTVRRTCHAPCVESVAISNRLLAKESVEETQNVWGQLG